MNKNSMRDVFMYHANLKGVTGEQLAKMFGISTQRVYQCIRKCKAVDEGKLHHGPNKEALKAYCK